MVVCAEKLAYINPTTNIIPIHSSLFLVVGALLILLFGLSTLSGGDNLLSSRYCQPAENGYPNCPTSVCWRLIHTRFILFGKIQQAYAHTSVRYFDFRVDCGSFPIEPLIGPQKTFNFNWAVAVGAVLLSFVAWFLIGHKYKGAAFVSSNGGAIGRGQQNARTAKPQHGPETKNDVNIEARET